MDACPSVITNLAKRISRSSNICFVCFVRESVATVSLKVSKDAFQSGHALGTQGRDLAEFPR